MKPNEEPIETLDTLDDTTTSLISEGNIESKEALEANSEPISKPQPINVESLAKQVAPTDLNSTNISNFGQEGIPLDNINQNPKPSTLETVPKSEEYNNIGSVPPNAYIEAKPPQSKKKLLFIIIAFVLVIAVGIFIYIYLHQGNKKGPKLVLKTVSIEAGESVSTKIEDYIENSNTNTSGCLLNTESVLNNKIGNYKYKIICGSETYIGDLKVVDSVPPIVETKYVTKKVNEEVKIEDFISKCDDASTCHYAYVDENKVNEAIKTTGTYEIAISITDDYDNKVEVTSYLIVLVEDITHNLICSTKDIQANDNKYSYIITDTLGLYSDKGFVFGNVASRDYTLKFTEQTNYNEIKSLILEDGTLEVDNIKGKAIFNDNDMTIKVSKLLVLEDLNKEFSSFPSSYGDIRKLYQNDSRGFSCSANKIS